MSLSVFKTDAELDRLPTAPGLFGCGEEVVEDITTPRQYPKWCYYPIFGNMTQEKINERNRQRESPFVIEETATQI